MLELTRKGEYAVRGILYLAAQPEGTNSLVGDIATAVDVPKAFLAKILQDFVKAGLVVSFRGTGGGFSLAQPADRITLLEVVEAVEGPVMPNRCLVTAGSCERDSTCRVHPVWQRVRSEIITVLGNVTLDELVT